MALVPGLEAAQQSSENLLTDWNFWNAIVALGALAWAITERRLRKREERRGKKEREEIAAEAERDQRVQRVVDRYLELRRGSRDAGYHGMLAAGVGTLETHDEIVDACRLITAHNERHPIRVGQEFPELDLHRFFGVAATRGYDFLSKGNDRELAAELVATRQDEADSPP